jgi:hypothetical protein
VRYYDASLCDWNNRMIINGKPQAFPDSTLLDNKATTVKVVHVHGYSYNSRRVWGMRRIYTLRHDQVCYPARDNITVKHKNRNHHTAWHDIRPISGRESEPRNAEHREGEGSNYGQNKRNVKGYPSNGDHATMICPWTEAWKQMSSCRPPTVRLS